LLDGLVVQECRNIVAKLGVPLGQSGLAGDDWEIPGALLDANGNPLDLTGAEFEWVLIDSGRNPITLAAEVDVTDPADGAIPASDTTGLDPGFYTDALHVTFAGSSTVWHGHIIVVA
jgi:hypothetical protein